ncbi:unannotated protein [freshwater metagenome]|uniref:Unannotated protein n=1 Tax=freshwater metagenome TaxID=449393 RepID=A0A6J6HDZ0_9ZZZZ
MAACPSPATAVGVPGASGATKTEYTFLTKGVVDVPTRMKPSDRMTALFTVPPVVLLYTKVLSTVPSVLNRLRLPLNEPPTMSFPSLCNVAVSDPEGIAAAAVFVLYALSAAPAEVNFLIRPVKSPTT